MSRLHAIAHRLRVLLRGERYAREQAREVEFHLELEALAHSHTNESAVAAELAARRAFGNVTYYREEARRMTLLHWTDWLRQDARYALRGLRRSRGFTATVMVTLALGFGVNAAMFSLLRTLFFRAPDGVTAPESVRRIYVAPRECRGADGCFRFLVFRYPHYRTILDARPSAPVAFYTHPDSATVDVNGARFAAQASRVSRAYFTVLGARPELGRFLAPEEDSVYTPALVAVISDVLWRSKLGADPHIIGRTLTIDHRSFTIIGVASRGFRGIELDATDLWLPMNTYQGSGLVAQPWYDVGPPLNLIARVQSTSEEAALIGITRNALRSMQPTLSPRPDSSAEAVAGPIVGARGPIKLTPELEVTTRIGAVAMIVLLIAVTNVVNLLLLRAIRRRREIALRLALGVPRARLAGQLAVEGLILSLLGGAGATLVAYWTSQALRHLILPRVHWAQAPIDASTIVFLIGVSIGVGVTAGLAPALHALRANVIDSLKAGQRDGGYRRSRLRSVLLTTQAALCVVLIVGAGLFLRSLNNVQAIDVGYDVTDVVSVQPAFPAGTDLRSPAVSARVPEIVRRLEHLNGVEAVGYAQGAPMGSMIVQRLFLPDRDAMPRGPGNNIPSVNMVSGGYFDAVGMQVVRGRTFAPYDGPSASRVVVVNETMARIIWPGESALGKCIILDKRTDPCATVVGVVNDAHRLDVIEAPPMMLYYPVTQQLATQFPAVNIALRVRPGQMARVLAAAEREMKAVIPGLDGMRVWKIADVVDRQLQPWRLGAVIFVAFGALAFGVAGVGVYSVVAYGVAQRTHEMGIRIALGAQTKEILDLVVADGLRAVAAGVVIGIVAALALGPLVRSLLFGITPSDPSVFIVAAIALCVLGAVASLVPALRASRVDPVVALRSD